MKIGIGLNINVSKIEKERLFQGKNGKYLNLTVFVDTDAEDEYGNNGGIAHAVSKEERERGVKGSFIGNAKVFYTADSDEQSTGTPKNKVKQPEVSDFDDDIPF